MNAPTCGERSTFGRAAKGMDEGGSVEYGPADVAGGEGVIEGAFINDAAPCHVDEHGGGLHEPEFAGTDKVFGLRGEGAVDTDEI